MDEKKQGLTFRKWIVVRRNDPNDKHNLCEKFVLDLHHDKFSIPALEAYANACEKEYPFLAADLREKIETLKGTNHG